MAKNPVVDGVTNLAIPDAPHGVYMAGHSISGSLFGIETVVGGSVTLSKMKVGGDVDLTRMNVKGHAGCAGLTEMMVEGNVSLTGMRVGYARLSEMSIGNMAYFDEMNVDELTLGGTNVGTHLVLEGTRVRRLLLQYPVTVRGGIYLQDAVIEEFEYNKSYGGKPAYGYKSLLCKQED